MNMQSAAEFLYSYIHVIITANNTRRGACYVLCSQVHIFLYVKPVHVLPLIHYA